MSCLVNNSRIQENNIPAHALLNVNGEEDFFASSSGDSHTNPPNEVTPCPSPNPTTPTTGSRSEIHSGSVQTSVSPTAIHPPVSLHTQVCSHNSARVSLSATPDSELAPLHYSIKLDSGLPHNSSNDLIHKQRKRFPERLMDILHQVEESIIEWVPDEKMFIINDEERFSSQVLQHYLPNAKVCMLQYDFFADIDFPHE